MIQKVFDCYISKECLIIHRVNTRFTINTCQIFDIFNLNMVFLKYLIFCCPLQTPQITLISMM